MPALASVAETAPGDASVPGETCPRCHTTESWGTDSWCPNCGFYPSIDAEGINDTSWQDHMPVEEEESPPGNLLAELPVWFWIMMGGITGILFLGLAIRIQAAEQESVRGIIALSTLAGALAAIAAAHVVACIDAIKNDRRIRPMDAVISWFVIWQPTITQLPATRGRIWTMSWGVTGVVTAILIIGGIDYNAPFRTDAPVKTKPFGNKVIQTVSGAAKAAGQNNGPASMEEALTQLSDPDMMTGSDVPGSIDDAVSNLASAADSQSAPGDAEQTRKSILCVVYGMTTDQQNAPAGFLFAGKSRNEFQHIALIHARSLPTDEYQRLSARLSRNIRATPAIPTEHDAVWVDPVLVCKIRYVRLNEDGTVSGAEFDSIVREGTRRSGGRAAGSKRGRRQQH